MTDMPQHTDVRPDPDEIPDEAPDSVSDPDATHGSDVNPDAGAIEPTD